MSKRRPLFARCYFKVSAADLKRGGDEHRKKLLYGIGGRVLEVGCGHGLNFDYYPAGVGEVVAVEPEPYLRKKAAERARSSPLPITVLDGVAEHLPVPTDSFDAVVMSLVLCSVRDQGAVLDEAARSLAPGGELRYYEHVRATDPGLARVQKALDRTVWPRIAGGCHCSRDTGSAIRAAGFRVLDQEDFFFSTCVLDRIVAPHILGRAVKREGSPA